MKHYYIDARTREIIEDVALLAPELYWEYRRGTQEGIILEQWFCGTDENGNRNTIDFSHVVGDQLTGMQREMHFKRHNAKPQYLVSYTVPPSWYDEEIAAYNGEVNETLSNYKVFWSYQSMTGYEDGTVSIRATSPADAESKFYDRNTPHRVNGNRIGWSVDSVEPMEEEGSYE